MVEGSHPATGSTDDAIVRALRAGDESAFRQLVQRFHRPLMRLAQTYVHSPAVAEEVVQDTWIAVITGIDRFESRSSLRTWIFRILTYQARSRVKRERRTIPMSEFRPTDGESHEPSVDPSRFRPASDRRLPGHWADPPVGWGSGVERHLLDREAQNVIAASLDAMPASQRLVMTLRDLEGWSSDEVCAALDITAGNQRVLLHRARSRVRLSLERYFQEAALV